MIKTITVGELKEFLADIPNDYKFYTTSDPEGNNYCSFRSDYMAGGSNEDRVLVLYPIETTSNYADIAPIDDKKLDDEAEAAVAMLRADKLKG